jgi:hypothetical protein
MLILRSCISSFINVGASTTGVGFGGVLVSLLTPGVKFSLLAVSFSSGDDVSAVTDSFVCFAFYPHDSQESFSAFLFLSLVLNAGLVSFFVS